MKREIKQFNGSEYHNWTFASGVLHSETWLQKNDEQKLQLVITWFKEHGYEYYEQIHWIASSCEYVQSYARGEGRIVSLGPREFFLPGAWVGRLTDLITHTQKYLTKEQAQVVVSTIRQQCPDWKIDLQHASQCVKSISPDWDEWRIEVKGIWNGGKMWTWSINEVGDWPIYCKTMKKDHLLWYASEAI